MMTFILDINIINILTYKDQALPDWDTLQKKLKCVKIPDYLNMEKIKNVLK